jgi:hypothetical protein
MNTRFALPALVCAALLFPQCAAAQTVTGTVVNEAGGAPVRGALVSLLDAAGKRVGSALTDAQGAFALRAPGPGEFRVRAERVGMSSASSEPLPLAAGETRVLRLAARSMAVMLEGIQVQAAGRGCVVSPGAGASTAALWDEARKALDAAEFTREQKALVFAIRCYRRVLDPERLTVRQAQEDSTTGRFASPFTALPAEDLARGGYVRARGDETLFYPPDAAVLLSDTFLDQHCFRVRRGRGENAGQVGLEFEPVRGRTLPDVRGVLWLDAATAELRTLDYAFTGVAPGPDDTPWGGRVHFDRLPSGGWIVRRWSLRMPQMGRPAARPELGLMGRSGAPVVVAVVEVGGEVARVDEAPAEPRRAAVAGVVWDSTRAAGVAGARVFLDGTGHNALTGADGRFRIEQVPEGRYRLAWSHPRADSLGFTPPPAEVEVGAGGEAAVAFSIPRALAARDTVPRRAERTVALDTLTAVSRARLPRLERAGVYERQRTGLGRHMGAEAFQRRDGARITDRISGMMGIFARNRGGTAVVFTRRHARTECVVPVFLDGTQTSATELNRLRPEEVAAVEVYEGSDVPGRFIVNASRPCGAIAVWTRVPE